LVVSCGLLLPPEQEKTAIKLSSYIAQKSGTASIYKTNLPYVSLYETVFPRRNIEKIKKVIKIIAENMPEFLMEWGILETTTDYVILWGERTEVLALFQREFLHKLNPLREGYFKEKYLSILLAKQICIFFANNI